MKKAQKKAFKKIQKSVWNWGVTQEFFQDVKDILRKMEKDILNPVKSEHKRGSPQKGRKKFIVKHRKLFDMLKESDFRNERFSNSFQHSPNNELIKELVESARSELNYSDNTVDYDIAYNMFRYFRRTYRQ